MGSRAGRSRGWWGSRVVGVKGWGSRGGGVKGVGWWGLGVVEWEVFQHLVIKLSSENLILHFILLGTHKIS